MLLGEVLRAEALHRRDERRRLPREVEREAIGAALVPARHGERQRQQHHRHGARREQQQRQAGRVRRSA